MGCGVVLLALNHNLMLEYKTNKGWRMVILQLFKKLNMYLMTKIIFTFCLIFSFCGKLKSQNISIGNSCKKKVDIYYIDDLLKGTPLLIEAGGTKTVISNQQLTFIIADSNQFFYTAKSGDVIKIIEKDNKIIFISNANSKKRDFFKDVFFELGQLRQSSFQKSFKKFHTILERDTYYETVYENRIRFLNYYKDEYNEFEFNYIKKLLFAVKIKNKLNLSDKEFSFFEKQTLYKDSLQIYYKMLQSDSSFGNYFLINDAVKTIQDYYFDINPSLDSLQIIRANFSGRELEFLSVRFLLDFIKSNTLEKLSSDSLILKYNIKTPYFIFKIKNAIISRDLNKKLSKTDDIFLNYTNNSISFSNLSDSWKGKVTYIDLWATWCAPCLQEMEMSRRKLITSDIGKRINLVFISLDVDNQLWLDNQVKGLMSRENSFFLIGNFSSKFSKQFGITTIPRYIILDKEGKIIDSDAPRPSDPKLKIILTKLLVK
jgi:thiol-disulfide isomerase/thioredoxin